MHLYIVSWLSQFGPGEMYLPRSLHLALALYAKKSAGHQKPRPPHPHLRSAFNKFRTSSRLFWGRGVCSAVVRDRVGQSQEGEGFGQELVSGLDLHFQVDHLALVSFQLLYLLQPFLYHLKEEKENYFFFK